MDAFKLPFRQKNRLTAIYLEDFISTELPKRELIMAPWLSKQGLSMIYAPRGVGKTHMSLGIAHAVASGSSFLDWSVPKPRKVLFVDGEMPANVLQERCNDISRGLDNKISKEMLSIITPDLQRNGTPDISTPQGQIEINQYITKDTELIILDNLSTLMHSGRENEAESWLPVQRWAIDHRSQGRSVIFIHHSGKNGGQRGTSRREDVLDTVISLRRPEGYKASQGAAFEVHFEKSRGIYGDDVIPFLAKLSVDDYDKNIWSIDPLEETNYEKALVMIKNGKIDAEIGRCLGVDRSTIGRYRVKAKNEGLV